MRAAALAALVAAASAAAPGARALAGTAPFVGGYVMANGPDGLAKLALLASNAATLPLTRVFIGFLSPTMVYVPGSANLSLTGLNLTAAADGGFAAVKAAVGALRAAGVDVLLSMGGTFNAHNAAPARCARNCDPNDPKTQPYEQAGTLTASPTLTRATRSRATARRRPTIGRWLNIVGAT